MTRMIYILLAEGFEEIEALTPADLLRRAGKEVKLVGLSGREASGPAAAGRVRLSP